MKARSVFLKSRPIWIALRIAVLTGLLAGLGACTSYNPYTGQQEIDAGKTMAAVGTAAFVGSVVDNSIDRHNYYNDNRYRRPSYHRHYHHRRY